MARFLRQSRFGGVSECRSPEEMVGKGRCHHILGGEDSINLTIHYNRQDRCHYVDLGKERPTKKKLEKYEGQIRSFLAQLSNQNIDEARAIEIIGKIR